MSFEDKLKKLEDISIKMRENSIVLEDSINSFEEGMKIANELEKELNSYEKRVKILIENGSSETIEDFS